MREHDTIPQETFCIAVELQRNAAWPRPLRDNKDGVSGLHR